MTRRKAEDDKKTSGKGAEVKTGEMSNNELAHLIRESHKSLETKILEVETEWGDFVDKFNVWKIDKDNRNKQNRKKHSRYS